MRSSQHPAFLYRRVGVTFAIALITGSIAIGEPPRDDGTPTVELPKPTPADIQSRRIFEFRPSADDPSVLVAKATHLSEVYDLRLGTSNTGTDETHRWQQHLGFTGRHLNKRGGELDLNLTTSSFDGYFAGSLDYEESLNDRIRGHLGLAGSLFKGSEIARSRLDFDGQGIELSGGARIVLIDDLDSRVRNQLFAIDIGLRILYSAGQTDGPTSPTSPTLPPDGDSVFLIPTTGITYRYTDRRHALHVHAGLDTQPGAVGSDDDLRGLGRPEVDRAWSRLHAHAEYRVAIDGAAAPVFNGQLPPEVFLPLGPTLGKSVIEIAMLASAQTSFGAQLLPQETLLLGGFETVRGYPESFVSGDQGVFGSIEPRIHFGRTVENHGKRTWDLIGRVFADAGYIDVADAPSPNSASLASVGAGLELLVESERLSLSARVDWGTALLDAGEIDAGESETHVSVFGVLHF